MLSQIYTSSFFSLVPAAKILESIALLGIDKSFRRQKQNEAKIRSWSQKQVRYVAQENIIHHSCLLANFLNEVELTLVSPAPKMLTTFLLLPVTDLLILLKFPNSWAFFDRTSLESFHSWAFLGVDVERLLH